MTVARWVSMCLACVCLAGVPAAARATPSAILRASFTPEVLGARTTLGFSFQILAPAGQVPPALTEVDLRYPNYLGFALSGLGLATCTQERLQESGPSGCPANSILGYGTTLAEIALGPSALTETASVTILRAPNREGRFALLVYALGTDPIEAHVVLPAMLFPTSVPFGGSVNFGLPLVPGLPGGPDVAVVRMRATIGPRGVAYYEQVAGRTLAYQPPGIPLPKSCPRGGFPFAAEFGFVDGSHTFARAAVPCPRHLR